MSGKFTANSSNSEPCGCEKQLNICVENCFCVVVRQFKVNVLLTVGFGTNFCSSRKWLSLHQNFRAMRSLFLLLVIVLPFAGTVLPQGGHEADADPYDRTGYGRRISGLSDTLEY